MAVLYNDFYAHFNPGNDRVRDGLNPPDDIASWGIATNSADAFGGVVGFDETPDTLTQFSTIMSNWYGYAEDGDGDGTTPLEGDTDDPGITTPSYDTSLTLELYEVDWSGGDAAPGALIAADTETHTIAARQLLQSDGSNASFVGTGTDFVIDWDLDDLSPGVDEILFMVRLDNVGDPTYQNADEIGGLNIASTVFGGADPDVDVGNEPDAGTFWRSDTFTGGNISRFETGQVFARVEGFSEPNAAPVANDDSASVVAGETVVVNVLANDTDDNGDPLSVQSLDAAPGGVVTIDGGTAIRFTAQNLFQGAVPVTYTVSDGRGGTDTATLTVNVIGPPERPTAVTDAFTAPVNTTTVLDPLANDVDPNGDPVTLTNVLNHPAAQTSLTDDGRVEVVPHPSFEGLATITYEIADPDGNTHVGRMNVTFVEPGSTPPPLDIDPANVFEAGADARIFGRPGQEELVVLGPDARDVVLNAEIDYVELPFGASSLAMTVGNDGVSIEAGTKTLFTAASLNDDLNLRLFDGVATIRQTGAESFELTGDGSGVGLVGTPDQDVDVSAVM